MRRLLFLFFATAALNLAAQTVPPGLQPVPEPPPAPHALDGADEPQITIVKRGNDKVEEYRLNGKLYMQKVTPPHGVPYYLIDNRGDGMFSRQDALDTGLRVPMWVIGTF